MLFSGTLRSNLDPFDTKSDHDIWRALEQSHLKDFVTGVEKGLLHDIVEGGENIRYVYIDRLKIHNLVFVRLLFEVLKQSAQGEKKLFSCVEYTT